MRRRPRAYAYNPEDERVHPVNKYCEKTDVFSAGVAFAELLLDRHRLFNNMRYIDVSTPGDVQVGCPYYPPPRRRGRGGQ
eukprot:9177037-Pyramimonas_sp.AAC.1